MNYPPGIWRAEWQAYRTGAPLPFGIRDRWSEGFGARPVPNRGWHGEWADFMSGAPLPFGIRDRWSEGFGTFRPRLLNPLAPVFRPRF